MSETNENKKPENTQSKGLDSLKSLQVEQEVKNVVAEPEVKEYEPRDALVSKEEGLCDIKRIIDAAHLFLSPEGWLVLETGITQHEALSAVARKIGYRTIESKRDLQNQPRFLFMQR